MGRNMEDNLFLLYYNENNRFVVKKAMSKYRY